MTIDNTSYLLCPNIVTVVLLFSQFSTHQIRKGPVIIHNPAQHRSLWHYTEKDIQHFPTSQVPTSLIIHFTI